MYNNNFILRNYSIIFIAAWRHDKYKRSFGSRLSCRLAECLQDKSHSGRMLSTKIQVQNIQIVHYLSFLNRYFYLIFTIFINKKYIFLVFNKKIDRFPMLGVQFKYGGISSLTLVSDEPKMVRNAIQFMNFWILCF